MSVEATADAPTILAPVVTGSGAIVVHRQLERHLDGYRVFPYAPRHTFIPPLLWWLARRAPRARIVHALPDHGVFFHRPGVPLVLTFHNLVIDREMRPYSSFAQRLHYATDLRWLIRRAVARAAVLTAVSHDTARRVRRELGVTAPVEVIHNGVDADRFSPRWRRPDGALRVFFAGNLTRRKGVHWLPAIARRLPEGINVYYTQGLRTRSSLPLHPRLHPLGPVPHERMPERYREMDVLLLPTVREGLGLAILEAMASGLPVVTTDASSMPEQIDPGRGGFLCPLGDVDAFAGALVHLAGDPDLRRAMGEHNRARVLADFTEARMVADYRRLFDRLLD